MKRTLYARELDIPGLDPAVIANQGFEVNVGDCVRAIRKERGLSLRALADLSSVSINTLSLIENGKTSPSVNTLQKISNALRVPIVGFFLSKRSDQKIIYTNSRHRQRMTMAHGTLEDLGSNLPGKAPEPFIVTLSPYATSGPDFTMHLGFEFVFCLAGRMEYRIENQRYILDPGDSLYFEACLPHCWQNLGVGVAKIILILCPANDYENAIKHHFGPNKA
jgi:transcriptional regulator with XRE-family HTH domain